MCLILLSNNIIGLNIKRDVCTGGGQLGTTENYSNSLRVSGLIIGLFMSTLVNYVVPQDYFKNKITEIVRPPVVEKLFVVNLSCYG